MSLSTLASTAFRTARTTFHDLADAATGNEPVRASGGAAAPGQVEKAARAGSPAESTELATKAAKGRRRGTLLDAYA